jgi:hypothetical protein
MRGKEGGGICKSLHKSQNYRQKEWKKQTIVKKRGDAASNQSLFKSVKSSGKTMEDGQSESNCEKQNNAK